MECIHRDRLYEDGQYRFDYVVKFMDFSEEDTKAIGKVADQLCPLLPTVVDAVFRKLFMFDITKRYFLPRHEGFEGPTAVSLKDLTLDHPQIKFRKDFLTKYLNRILAGPYDVGFLKYLDWVAKIYTDTPQKKSEINVEYVHINALMGFVLTVLIESIMDLGLDHETEKAALTAFNKLFWIQNDCFAKYHCSPKTTLSTIATACCEKILDTPLFPVIIGAIAGALGTWFTLTKRK